MILLMAQTIIMKTVREIYNPFTGKSLSEALIFASTNPQYDDRLFIELQAQSLREHFCTEIFSDIENNFCKQHNLPKFCKKKSF